MPRLVSGSCCLIGLMLPSLLWSQSRMVPQVEVVSCAYADSLLGREWEKGTITGGRGPGGRVFMTSRSPGAVRTSIDLNVNVEYQDPTPPTDPYGSLQITVFNDRGLAQAMLRPDTTSLVLTLDDSLSFSLGSPIEGDVRGATRTSFMPLNVNLPRRAFLALARATRARVQVAGRSYPVASRLLKAVSRTYRGAVCLPPHSFPAIGQ